jgi:hypothetical protein
MEFHVNLFVMLIINITFIGFHVNIHVNFIIIFHSFTSCLNDGKYGSLISAHNFSEHP